jgi:4-diphosphocytidyl-2-C-methyl-D-erythritol kinase
MRTSRQGESLVVEAPAKLNLHLEVLGRRVDGYHDLETVMLAVDLCDTLRFCRSSDGRIVLRQAFAAELGSSAAAPPGGDDNLVVRAARRLAESTGCTHGVEIELLKRIPWQAGMGGGSSDAAATLLALNHLWELQLPVDELHRIAATLGSDLNFFIAQTPLALCSGRGEQIAPQPLRRRIDLVVAQPDGGLSTAAVFKRWQRHEGRKAANPLLAWLSGDSSHVLPVGVYNALQPAAEELHPGMCCLRHDMSALGLQCVTMTGSGSACFGVCHSRRQAQRVAEQLRSRSSGRAWAVQGVI